MSLQLHAILDVTFFLANGSALAAPFVVDTGFTGYLTLPPPDVATLQLPFLGLKFVLLADNSEVPLPVYEATILWCGEKRDIQLIATNSLRRGDRPLLGTALLDGCELNVQFTENGVVTVQEL